MQTLSVSPDFDFNSAAGSFLRIGLFQAGMDSG
jgi:hypothetical protein